MIYILFTGVATIAFTMSYLSIKTNQYPDNLKYFLALLGVNMIALWPFITRISTNLMRDALIFDAIMLFSFFIGYIMFSKQYDQLRLNYVEITGALVILGGFMIFKVGEFFNK